MRATGRYESVVRKDQFSVFVVLLLVLEAAGPHSYLYKVHLRSDNGVSPTILHTSAT